MARPKQVELFAGMHPTDEREEFEEFWKRYPRKRNKGDAWKAWKQTKKARPALGRLISAVDAARDSWREREAEFIPYPASWLRAHGWEDEPDPQPQEPSYDEKLVRMDRKRWRG